MITKALYGFSSDLSPFANQTPFEQAVLLKRWGANAIFGGYADPAFVDAIHAQGMKIYAEFGCFQGKQWWDTFPESRPILADGTPLGAIDWYCGVNPSIPVVREQLLEKLAILLTNYALDGVWLDFIRWPGRWESATPQLLQTSFDEPTLARFAADSIIDFAAIKQWRENPSANPDYTNSWVAWRMNQITSWVADARKVVDAIRPTATLGLFAVPWLQSDFEGAIHSVIGQNFAALADYVDIFSPMTYHLMCGQPTTWIADVAREIAQLTGKPICPIIQSVDYPIPLSVEEYQRALKATNGAADGVIVFTLQGIVEGDKIAATQQLWQSEQA
jgi:uncharacterized lipoprotein YddW (UPF0748 family)